MVQNQFIRFKKIEGALTFPGQKLKNSKKRFMRSE